MGVPLFRPHACGGPRASIRGALSAICMTLQAPTHTVLLHHTMGFLQLSRGGRFNAAANAIPDGDGDVVPETEGVGNGEMVVDGVGKGDEAAGKMCM